MLAPITRFLGYAGLIPFIALSALVQFAEPPLDFWAANSLLIYSASIASFVGALHWGPLLSPNLLTPTSISGEIPVPGFGVLSHPYWLGLRYTYLSLRDIS